MGRRSGFYRGPMWSAFMRAKRDVERGQRKRDRARKRSTSSAKRTTGRRTTVTAPHLIPDWPPPPRDPRVGQWSEEQLAALPPLPSPPPKGWTPPAASDGVDLARKLTAQLIGGNGITEPVADSFYQRLAAKFGEQPELMARVLVDVRNICWWRLGKNWDPRRGTYDLFEPMQRLESIVRNETEERR